MKTKFATNSGTLGKKKNFFVKKFAGMKSFAYFCSAFFAQHGAHWFHNH